MSTSLNGGARQRELVRIAQENQAILARIESQEPYYNTAQWVSVISPMYIPTKTLILSSLQEQEWRDAKTYMAFIAKFPHAGTYHRQVRKPYQTKLNHVCACMHYVIIIT